MSTTGLGGPREREKRVFTRACRDGLGLRGENFFREKNDTRVERELERECRGWVMGGESWHARSLEWVCGWVREGETQDGQVFLIMTGGV